MRLNLKQLQVLLLTNLKRFSIEKKSPLSSATQKPPGNFISMKNANHQDERKQSL